MSPTRIGFLVSGFFHLSLLLAVFFNVATNVPASSSDPMLSVSLDMFARQPEPEAVPEIETQDTAAIEQASAIAEIISAPKEIIPERPIDNTEQPPASRPVPKTASPSASGQDRLTHTDVAEPVLTAPKPDTTYIQLLEQQYTDALKQAIEARKFYPSRARRQAREGAVLVGFKINREGNIKNIHVVRSSSVRILDKAAINAVHSIGRFQPIPAHIDREWWEFEITLAYNLL